MALSRTSEMGKAFANHILAECEKEGLTIGETRLVASSVKLWLNEEICNSISAAELTGFIHRGDN